ncbi:MAG: sugar MFS transporter [Prevotella sp.]|uniref:sugar MFS transporter n=1 Tax=Prevotella sp. P3-122 TaxID=2024223 RepID=UPI000B9714F6|nr:sugar MFS transporter [Prevotella sp. P3-122]MCI6181038.1 sugar MFS transporter [Prevotella sp.]MCI6309170.1 sugar MFS transporter [Prevotella sp.]MCI6462472.1 sugar MFS transporter [Prevotella sp.]MCI6500386.1 sugar MFS transporter [Prevotella sp.]MCI6555389.1 sugar MFS transporter [Prevotella sp.]
MRQYRPTLTDRRYVVPFALITSLFFLWGFARAILDVLNKHFQNALDISLTQSSLIQVTTYLGYFLTAIPAGWFINRQGYRRGVVFGLALFALGSLMFIPGAAIGTFYAFLLPLFIIGCGLVFLETAANPYASELGDKATASSRLNFSQSFNGLGCLFATYVVGQFLFNGSNEGGDVVVPYTLLGILVMVIAVVFSRVHLPEIKHEETEEDRIKDTRIMKLFKHHPMFVFGLFSLLAYEIAEISINSYFINFVTGQGWMDDNSASMVLTVALGFFMVGRFLGSWIMRRIPAERMLMYCSLGSVSCLGVVLLDIGHWSMYALIANYLFEAIMFPTIFSLSLQGLGNLTKSASSLLMMTPIGGCFFLLMGYVADQTNLVVPFLIPFIGYFIVLLYASELSRKS